jgi:kynureninase
MPRAIKVSSDMTGITREALEQQDLKDPLASLRDKFYLPPDVFYLDGNSLGVMPHTAKERVMEVVVDEWGTTLIDSWVENGWLASAQRVGDKIGAMIGARPGEVVVADSTSINIFKTLVAALQANPNRHVILSETGNFPTDLYVMQGLDAFAGDKVSLRIVEPDDIVSHLSDDVAVLLLTQVHYKSGRIRDMKEITRLAHEAGILVVWDLSHSTGSIPVDLNDCAVDFAIGCGYKFLNGGPGAPAYVFAAERHHNTGIPVLSGWFAHADPFGFSDEYVPVASINRFQCGTPPVLAIALLECGIDLFANIDMSVLRDKAIALSSLFIELMDSRCEKFGFELVGPRSAADRGGHVSFAHKDGYGIMQAAKQHGVVGDFRAPDVMRFGITPMYLRYQDIFDVVDIIREVMVSGEWDKDEYKVKPAWS